ncbi:MAG TPA: GspMb/PilO family protein [Ramlibacter sp.]|nr:GspMb/PilO family protein [Ramlibacter sp.]
MMAWQAPAAAGMRMARRAGWPAALGGGLFAFALAYGYFGNGGTREQIAQVTEQQRKLRELAARPASEMLPAREQLTRFYQRFPGGNVSQDVLPAVLLGLHQSAKKQGLSALRADYRDSAEADTPLRRVRVHIPVRGSYKAVRAWLNDVVATMPEVAIDGLEIRRAEIGVDEVEAQARFTVLLRAER